MLAITACTGDSTIKIVNVVYCRDALHQIVQSVTRVVFYCVSFIPTY